MDIVMPLRQYQEYYTPAIETEGLRKIIWIKVYINYLFDSFSPLSG